MRAGRAGGVFQLTLLFRFLLLLLLQLFTAFLAGIIWFGQNLFLFRFLSRLGRVGVGILLLVRGGGLAFLLRFLFLVRLRRFGAHDAARSLARRRCQRLLVGLAGIAAPESVTVNTGKPETNLRICFISGFVASRFIVLSAMSIRPVRPLVRQGGSTVAQQDTAEFLASVVIWGCLYLDISVPWPGFPVDCTRLTRAK